ncbi:MAG: response regulator [Candidatus Omnitrophica bacterium]|nr:response regulator [Candidatus Omnitrophota bacterium]MBU1996735.1 response regulator [Candidatus Omnitrophota bacterium]
MTEERNKSKILIVDDDKGTRLMIRRLLTLENKYELEEAEDGLQAEDRLKTFKADLVILDIMMKEQDGYVTCKNIRKNESLKDIIIIGISGESQAIGKVFIEEYGADRFMEKPFNAKEFKEIIDRLLREKERSD